MNSESPPWKKEALKSEADSGDKIVNFIESAKLLMTTSDQVVMMSERVFERIKEHAFAI